MQIKTRTSRIRSQKEVFLFLADPLYGGDALSAYGRGRNQGYWTKYRIYDHHQQHSDWTFNCCNRALFAQRLFLPNLSSFWVAKKSESAQFPQQIKKEI